MGQPDRPRRMAEPLLRPAASAIRITRATAALGADVWGVDLSLPLDAETRAILRTALTDHLVLFFREQALLSVDAHIRLARAFGEIDFPLFRTTSSERPEVLVLDQVSPKGEGGDSWHADGTYMATPPMGAILQARILPPAGGDTCFASMIAAYEALSPAMKSFLDGLSATHSLALMVERTRHVAGASVRDSLTAWPPVSHPVVRVHPVSGAKMLNVNANWTQSIDGLSHAESAALLSFLTDHVKRPEFQVRLRWNLGDVAFWDNRAVQHYAVADYRSRRVMQRVSIAGDKPVGPANID